MSQYFEWDDEKARKNIEKHGVKFEEAATVFSDPFCQTWQDRIENGEQRWKTLGLSSAWRLLMIAHTVALSEAGETIRIISARKADRKERTHYEHS